MVENICRTPLESRCKKRGIWSRSAMFDEYSLLSVGDGGGRLGVQTSGTLADKSQNTVPLSKRGYDNEYYTRSQTAHHSDKSATKCRPSEAT